jgi:hypothetical protein
MDKYKTQHRLPEISFTFILITLGLVILITSLRYGFGTLEEPGPGLYPFFLGLSILLFSIVHLFLTLKAPSGEPLFDKGGIKKFSFISLTFILWILAMPYLGYVLVTLIASYLFCKIMKLEGWLKPLGLAAGTALLIYLLFDYWLYIDLPRGIFG